MRNLLLVGLCCIVCATPVRAEGGCAALAFGAPFAVFVIVPMLGNLFIAPITATSFHKPTGVEGQKYDKAAGLGGGSIPAMLGAGLSGLAFWFFKDFPSIVGTALPLAAGIVLATGAVVMNVFAGLTMDSVNAENSYQADQAHQFAGANYGLAAVEGVVALAFTGAAIVMAVEVLQERCKKT